MKANCVFLLVLMPFFFLSMTCRKESEKCHYNLWLNNTTDKPVCVAASFDYPDTSINFQNPMIDATNFMGPHTRKAFITEHGCIENYLNIYSSSDTLSIFIFDAEQLQYGSWRQIRQNYQILKRFDYSIDELRNTNFSIDFP